MARLQRMGWPRAGQLALLIAALVLMPPAGGQVTGDDSLPPVPKNDFTTDSACDVLTVTASTELRVRRAAEETAVRLIGVYVPRSGAAADAARAYIARLLDGESVYVRTDPDWPTSDDGRIWAYVYRAPDGLFINLELIRQGYARCAAAQPFEHQKLLRAYERLAQQRQKGIWAAPPAGHDDAPTSQPRAQKPPPPATQPAPAAANVDETIVYITEHGRKYHTQECRFASNARAVTLREAKALGLTPCSHCKPPP